MSDVDTSEPFVAGSGSVARATFWGANPRADLKHGGTFLTVERADDNGQWITVATDADFEVVPPTLHKMVACIGSSVYHCDKTLIFFLKFDF